MKAKILKKCAMVWWSKSILAGTLLASAYNLAFAQDAPIVTPTLAQVREAMKSQFPASPPGFAWELYKNVIFLKPDKWNEQEKTDYVADIPFATYVASPEKFSEKKMFEMGLTLEFISGSERITKVDVKNLPLALIKPLLDSHKKEEILIFEQGSREGFETTYFRYKDAPPGLKPVIIHKFFLANKATDIVNVITFESPEETWEENWEKYGTPIISKLSVLQNVPLLSAQESIPDDYEFVAVAAPNSYEFVKACMPSMSEASFTQSVRTTTDKEIIIHSTSDKTKPLVGIAQGRVYCIQMSTHKYPILPLSFFDKTITFDDMPKDEVRKLRTDLSRQLATTGIATALVLTDNGSAYQVGFVFNNNSPNRVYYHGSLLMKGEYDQKDFRAIYQTPGAMNISARGPPPEHYKSIF